MEHSSKENGALQGLKRKPGRPLKKRRGKPPGSDLSIGLIKRKPGRPLKKRREKPPGSGLSISLKRKPGRPLKKKRGGRPPGSGLSIKIKRLELNHNEVIPVAAIASNDNENEGTSLNVDFPLNQLRTNMRLSSKDDEEMNSNNEVVPKPAEAGIMSSNVESSLKRIEMILLNQISELKQNQLKMMDEISTLKMALKKNNVQLQSGPGPIPSAAPVIMPMPFIKPEEDSLA